MARPISWQSNLAELHRRVQDSPRSLYGREDLERLFDVRRTAAQSLLELMPRLVLGNGIVVEREALIQWLAMAIDAEDLGEHLAELRKNPPKPSRRKLRISLPRQLEDGNLQSIDRWNIELRRGKITLHFTTLDDLCGKLIQLSKVIDTPEFERRFCDAPPAAAISAAQQRLRDEAAQIDAYNTYFRKLACVFECDRRPEILPGVREKFCEAVAAALEQYRNLEAALGPLEDEDIEVLGQKMLARLREQKIPPQPVALEPSERTGTSN